MAAPTACWRHWKSAAASSSISSTRATRARSRRALSHKPALVWIETPSNPLLRIVDIREVAAAAHAAGALVAADNTFLSPLWQQPLALGADLVMHSTTKYLNGHSDVVGGAVIAASRGARQGSGLVGERHRRLGLAFRQLSDAAGRADAARAHEGARGEHAGRGRCPERPCGRAAGVLSGSAIAPGPRAGPPAAEQFRRDAELRSRRRRAGRERVSRRTRVLHPCRIPRRRGEPDLAPGDA